MPLSGGPEVGRRRPANAFDGAAEITTAEIMTRHPSGSGVARPMRWDFHTEAAGPVWDMYAALGRETMHDFAQGSHTQQVLHIRGSVTIDGTEYALDGPAANDHSSGAREMRNFGGHYFLVGALPGRALHTISIFGMDGSELVTAGTEFRATGDNPTLVLTDVPTLDRLDTLPPSFESTLSHDGERTPVRIDVLHQAPISITTDNDNINGVDTDGPDLLVLSEARVQLTLPDGTVGHAHLERSTQRSRLNQT